MTKPPSCRTGAGHKPQRGLVTGRLASKLARRSLRSFRPGSAGPERPRSLVERVAAGAGAGRVGVVDGEALLLDGVDEVDHRAVEVGHAHPVDDDGHAVEVGHDVAVEGALVEEQLVAQTAAAAGLDRDPQREVVATLLLEQALHLAGGDRAQVDLVGTALGDLVGHLVAPSSTSVSAPLTWARPGRSKSRTGSVIPSDDHRSWTSVPRVIGTRCAPRARRGRPGC